MHFKFFSRKNLDTFETINYFIYYVDNINRYDFTHG